MKIFGQGRVWLHDMIFAKLSLSDCRTGFDLCLEKKVLKVLIYPEA